METKPGYKTTEFWLTALASIVGLLIMSGVIPTDSSLEKVVGGLAMALSTIGYSVSRGNAKKPTSGTGTGVGLLLCSLIASTMLMGCKTPEQGAYRTLGTTAALVDSVMLSWGDYVRSGRATAGDQAAVRSAYEQYQGAMRVARSVVTSLKQSTGASDPTWVRVAAAVAASADDLVALIGRYIPEPKPAS